MDFKKHTEKRICLSNGTPENGGFSPKKGQIHMSGFTLSKISIYT
jgi:hypothetical protein